MLGEKFTRKSLLDGIWFDEELKIGEDLLFFFDVFSKSLFIQIIP